MRLVCPNCGAQYEIDAALVPEAGRDVQCSACGHTWFQRREFIEDELAEEAGLTVAAETLPEPAPAPDLEERETDRQPEPEPQPPEEPEVPAAEEKQRPRKPDETALTILREEAEREAEARRREAQGLEMQGDLGLSGEAPGRAERTPRISPAAIAAASTGAVVGQPPLPDADKPESAAKGRDVFPDIDEINSSLSLAEQEAVAAREAEIAAENKNSSRLGFRIGFLTVVVFVAALIVLYAFAPQLAESFPGLRPALADYVEWANGRREQVEGLMQSAAALLGGK